MIDVKDLENAIEITAAQEKLDSLDTKEDTNAKKIISSLNPKFFKQLKSKVFDFQNIQAQDIIDIVFEDQIIKDPIFRVSVTKICDYIGIKLQPIDNDTLHGSIGFNEDQTTLQICYQEKDKHYRNRFTIAHELGHLFKHLILGKKMEYKDYENSHTQDSKLLAARGLKGNDIEEIEADRFAGELLLPNDCFENIKIKFKNKKVKASLLASFFDISNQALYRTLINKGIDINSNDSFIYNDTRPW